MIRLNVGAGGRRLKGYTGVDIVKRPGADIIAPAHKIPLADGSCEEIIAIHIWEHFYRWQCDGVLKEWRRLLAPGGLLILELPNLIKACQNILSGVEGKHPDQLGMWACYGDPRQEDEFMSHRWGWTPITLTAILRQQGFVDIVETVPEYHLAGRENRDMRIEARRA